MEILVVMFIMFVLSKLFGGITQQMPQDQRRKGPRPFPDIPSEWNFPRPADTSTVDIEPVPSVEPSRRKSLMVSSQDKQLGKTKEQPVHSIGQFRENPLENLLVPENLISGIILAELLQPPKSKRGVR